MSFDLKPALDICDLNLVDIRQAKQYFFEQIIADPEFMELATYREQINYIAEISKLNDVKITLEDVAIFMNTTKQSVIKQIQKHSKGVKINGRPTLFTKEMKQSIIEYIKEKFEKGTPVTYTQIHNHVFKNFEKVIYKDTIAHFLKRTEEFRTVIGKPMEQNRLEASTEDIDEFYKDLEVSIDGVPAAFVFNCDESGVCLFQDSKEETVIVPNTYHENFIFYPVKRSSRRATILSCIAADGKSIKPLVILKRKTVQSEIKEEGYSEDMVSFKYQQNAFITKVLFFEWLRDVFCPFLDLQRELKEYYGPVLLILDNCWAHISEESDEICQENGIELKFIPPHSSDQLQPLDLCLFHCFKRKYSSLSFCKFTESATEQLISILESWYSIATPNKVVASFRAMGLIPIYRNGEVFLKVNRGSAKKVRHWIGVYHDGEENTQRSHRIKL